MDFSGKCLENGVRKVTTIGGRPRFLTQVLPSDPFGGFKWPFQGLSDLHLGDQRVTWKKLD